MIVVQCSVAVSYTHLDVYKRQIVDLYSVPINPQTLSFIYIYRLVHRYQFSLAYSPTHKTWVCLLLVCLGHCSKYLISSDDSLHFFPVASTQNLKNKTLHKHYCLYKLEYVLLSYFFLICLLLYKFVNMSHYTTLHYNHVLHFNYCFIVYNIKFLTTYNTESSKYYTFL